MFHKQSSNLDGACKRQCAYSHMPTQWFADVMSHPFIHVQHSRRRACVQRLLGQQDRGQACLFSGFHNERIACGQDCLAIRRVRFRSNPVLKRSAILLKSIGINGKKASTKLPTIRQSRCWPLWTVISITICVIAENYLCGSLFVLKRAIALATAF